MSNDLKYNIKINVDGKDYVVETTQNVKDLAKGMARVQKEAEMKNLYILTKFINVGIYQRYICINQVSKTG